ncbi:hypothetical protein H8E77_25490 [bacterium]|nr:hypothetical protein [bacterium]
MKPMDDLSRPMFVETTAAIHRHFGTFEQQEFVIQAMKNRRIITCTFVLFEYKRVVQRPCVELHRLLTRTGDINEAFRLYGQSYSVSQLSIGYSLFPPILGQATDNIREVLGRLESLIENDLSALFRLDVDEITDATHCALAYRQPVRYGNTYASGFLSVSRAAFDCDLPNFIEANRDAFQAVYDALTEERSQRTRRLRQTLARVLRNPAESRGRNALILADLVIAVEMPAEALLLTTNRRDFEKICSILGKDIFPHTD